MKIQELIILGILKMSPKHGYQIKKTIQEKLGLFTSLENRSIYYPLKVMEKSGWIKRTASQKQGRLLRYVYSLTPKGNKEFLKLAMEALISERRPFIDIDIPLYFLPFLDTKEVLVRLRLRKRFLEKVKIWLEQNLNQKKKLPSHQKLLLKHHLNLLNAEEAFVEEIIRIVRSSSAKGDLQKP